MNKQNKDLAYLSNINYIEPIHIYQATFLHSISIKLWADLKDILFQNPNT